MSQSKPTTDPLIIVNKNTINQHISNSSLAFKKFYICSKRQTGKTHLAIKIIKNIQVSEYPADFIQIFSPTEKINAMYSTEIIETPKCKINISTQLNYEIEPMNKQFNHVIIVLDDIIPLKYSFSDMQQIINIKNITLIMIVQYPVFGDLITQFNYIAWGNEIITSNRHKEYVFTKKISDINSFKEFNNMHKKILESDNLTNNKSFILVKNTQTYITKISYDNNITDITDVTDTNIDLLSKQILINCYDYSNSYKVAGYLTEKLKQKHNLDKTNSDMCIYYSISPYVKGCTGASQKIKDFSKGMIQSIDDFIESDGTKHCFFIVDILLYIEFYEIFETLSSLSNATILMISECTNIPLADNILEDFDYMICDMTGNLCDVVKQNIYYKKTYGVIKQISDIHKYDVYCKMLNELKSSEVLCFKNINRSDNLTHISLDNDTYIEPFNFDIDYNELPQTNTCVLIISSDQYLSINLTKTIFKHHQNTYDQIVAFSNSNSSMYSDAIYSVHSLDDLNFIQTIVNNQIATKNKDKYMIVINFIEFLESGKKISQNIIDLIFNHSKYNISLIIISDLYIKALNKSLFDIIFVSHDTTHKMEQILYDNYFSGCTESFKQFRTIYENICKSDNIFLTMKNRELKELFVNPEINLKHIGFKTFADPIFEFNIENFKNQGYSSMCVIGSDDIQKHLMVKYLLDNMNYDIETPITVLTKTNKKLYENITDNISDNLILEIKTILRNQRNNLKDNNFNINPIIIIDSDFTSKEYNDYVLIDLMMNNKQYRIKYILLIDPKSTQNSFLSDLAPQIRGNFDYVFIDPMASNKIEQTLFNKFFDMFSTFESFKQTYDNMNNQGKVLSVCIGGSLKCISDKVHSIDINAYKKIQEDNRNIVYIKQLQQLDYSNPIMFESNKPKILIIGSNSEENVKTVCTHIQSIKFNPNDDTDKMDLESETGSECGSINSEIAHTIKIHTQPIDYVVVITQTNKSLYENLTESIYEDPDVIQIILNNQEKSPSNHYMFVIELTDQNKKQLNTYIDKIINNSKELNLSLILICTNPTGPKPEIRGCFDYVYVSNFNQQNMQKRIYDHYFNFIKSFDIFKHIYNQLTFEPKQYMVTNRKSSNNISDRILWFSIMPDSKIDKKYPMIPYVNISDIDLKSELEKKIESHNHMIKSATYLLQQAQKESDEIKLLINRLIK
jgi:hypothetical protein